MEMVLPPSCRLSDWRHRLDLYLAAARGRPFAYGRHDCATFASGAVAALTGTDPIAALGIRYTTLRGGRRALLARGYADSIAFLRALLPEIPVVRAGLGDRAVVETAAGPALTVVGGAVVFAVAPERGLSVLPLLAATTAFEV